MGGQACVFYGAAEFSRDCDIVILTEAENLIRLESAIKELDAVCIAVPPMDWRYLERGHAIHFRCQHPAAHGIRLDVMAKMRGCREFDLLWKDRTSVEIGSGAEIELLGIEDLVKAKKTQREKDWPMIQRLVEAHYAEFSNSPSDESVQFWLTESRTPAMLLELANRFPLIANALLAKRGLLNSALAKDASALRHELEQERLREMADDELYWRPLVKELEAIRLERRKREE